MLVLSRKREEWVVVGGPRAIPHPVYSEIEEHLERGDLSPDDALAVHELLDRLRAALEVRVDVVVVDVRGDKVRLGFIAPEDVPVHRKEVYDSIAREDRHR